MEKMFEIEFRCVVKTSGNNVLDATRKAVNYVAINIGANQTSFLNLFKTNVYEINEKNTDIEAVVIDETNRS